MILLTNTAAQTVQPGQAVTFNRLLRKTGCGECYDTRVPNSVKLMGKGGTYEVDFSANISGATAGEIVQLAIALGTVGLPETVMVSTPAAAGDFNNVSTGTYVDNNCCDNDRIAVINTGTTPVTISANMNLRIRRFC